MGAPTATITVAVASSPTVEYMRAERVLRASDVDTNVESDPEHSHSA